MDVTFVVISILLVIADGFTVHGPSGPLVAPLGSSVVLPCYVDKPLQVQSLEVEWRRTDSDADSETLVHLYEDGESRPETQHQDYHDRAHFFTDQIQHGNFSIRLDNLTAEDEGNYTCRVYSDQDSGETVVQIKDVERLLVSGSSRSTSASVGEDVTLNCSVDSHITPEHIEEVSWKKTDGDEDILVLLYQDNEALPDLSDEQYRDRVEFFTDEIPKGNFSLRLKNVRTEDKGVYMCQVFAGGLSANATVVLERLGFSSLHITVLVFCIAAASGAVLLLCCLIYCRSKDTVSSSTIRNLKLSLVFFPNICMSFAFIFWGFTEGLLIETVTCCALYILRPVMLIWALPYLKCLQDNIKRWTRFFKISELTVFTVVVYSVLFTYGWRKSAHDASIIPRVISGMCFGVVVLLCLTLFTVDLKLRGASSRHRPTVFCWCIFLLSLCQLFQLFSSFGLPFPAFLAVAFVQVVLLPSILLLSHLQANFRSLRRWITSLWIITISLLDIILVIYIHLTILEKEKDYLEWTSVGLFIEVLKMIVVFESFVTVIENSRHQRRQRQQTEMNQRGSNTLIENSQQLQQTKTNQRGSNILHLCNEVMYMFGAVGLVLLSSVTLTAELILKARNGERVMKDLRVVVFSSECVFACYWLVLQMHAFWKIVTTESTHNQNTADS